MSTTADPSNHLDVTTAEAQGETALERGISCSVCGDLAPWAPETANLFHWTHKSGQDVFIRRVRAEAILAAADLGCAECLMLKIGLNAFTKLPENGPQSMVKIVVADEPYKSSVIASLQSKDRVEFFSAGPKESLFPAVGPMSGLARNSSECTSDIKYFREKCLEQHETCCPKGPFRLPKRVIDVGDDNNQPKLHITNGETTEYIALSHCWGSSAHCKLTKANLVERQSSISIESLPKTYRDVVDLARRMDIRYVWIDSLCIIQDDTLDWEQQAAQMGTIYRNASFTVAATHGPNGDAGLFSDRPEHLLTRNLTFQDPDGQPVFVAYARKPILSHEVFFYGFHREKKSDYPLEDRAWCFQERILSTRIAHFTKDELVWECNGFIRCECEGIIPGEHSRTLREKFRQVMTETDTQRRITAWMEVLVEFCARRLTYESDRLPALASLARALQEKGFGDYIAGCWITELPRQLLWYRPTARAKSMRPYRAPSWSFASAEGSHISDCLRAPFKGIKMIGSPNGNGLIDGFSTWTTHAQLTEWKAQPSGTDPLGNLSNAFIVLTAPTQNCTISWEFPEGQDKVRHFVHCLDSMIGFSPDYELPKKDPIVRSEGEDASSREHAAASTKAVLIAICTEKPQMVYHGEGSTILHLLVLLQVGQQDKYERIGTCALKQEGEGARWLSNAEDKTVTII